MRGPDLHLPTQKSVLRNKSTDSFINTTLFKQNKQAEDFQRRILLKSEYAVIKCMLSCTLSLWSNDGFGLDWCNNSEASKIAQTAAKTT